MKDAGPGKTREVVPGVLEVFLPLPSKPSIINVYLLDCGQGEWALVDTGVALDASRAAFAAALREAGIPSRAVTRLIGTHHHPDHFGASTAYREECGGRVYLHNLELERIRYSLSAGAEDMMRHFRRHGMPIPQNATGAPRPNEVWAGTFQPTQAIDEALEDGMVLDLGQRRLQVIWTPGHTPGHCCLLDLEDRVLFVGDHLLPKITPHVGIYPGTPPNPLGDFLASQEKIGRLAEVRTVCPAHGPVYGDHAHRAAQIIAHHEYRLREVIDAARRGPQTAFQIASRVFPWVFEDLQVNRFQIGAAVLETLAHLELLRARGNLVAWDREDVLHWQTPGRTIH
jgi:glyoxylase-like metal-dependent hydrolase (beta-lactamase superfamily II)